MQRAPSSPAGFFGWGQLAPLEAEAWGWTFLPGKRPLSALALAQAGAGAIRRAIAARESQLKKAKARGRKKLEAAAKAHGTDFATMLDAYKRGQKAMANFPRD